MVLLWFLAGGAVEVCNALLRKWTVSKLRASTPRRIFVLFWGAALVRVLAAALVLFFAFKYSFLSGWFALAGYWVCRWLMLTWINRQFSK